MNVLRVIEPVDAFDGPMQMAIDEVLYCDALVATLRFYQWNQPQYTFGYFQKYAEVVAAHSEALLTRRWTGGGVVAHGNDCTFSLILPSGHPLVKGKSIQIYSKVHEAIMRSLGKVGIAARLADDSDAREHSHCFQGAAPRDVLVEEQKIAGGAIRRGRMGVLLQESICNRTLFLRERERQISECGQFNWKELVEELGKAFHCRPQYDLLTENEFKNAIELANEKYSREFWLCKR